MQRYADILRACDAIFEYTRNFDAERFSSDEKTRDAVERQLLKMAEAASKLAAQAEQDLPRQPWAAIRGLGNRLRHEYDAIDTDTIWALVENGQLASLQTDIAALLAEHDGNRD